MPFNYEKPWPLIFFLTAPYFVKKRFGFFGTPRLTTEWNDFNRAFGIHYKDKEGITDDRDIIGTLDPIVQEKLVQFQHQCGRYTLLFRKDAMIVRFGEAFFDAQHTNFLRKIEIDRRDIDVLEGRLKVIMQLAVDIVPHLD